MEKNIAGLIGEISRVATLINIQGKHHVFVEDSGHVQTLRVKIYKNGWKTNNDATLSQEISYCANEDDTEEEKNEFQKYTLKELKTVRDTLYKFLNNGRVSMKRRNYDVEEIKHYKFY